MSIRGRACPRPGGGMARNPRHAGMDGVLAHFCCVECHLFPAICAARSHSLRLPPMSPPSASTELLFDGADSAAWKISLAHGAGAGMDTPFMNAFSQALAQRGYRVARFEFPYMAQRRQGGGGRKRPPDREAVLRATWLEVIERLGSDRLVIGGKSMGGRIAS